MLWAKIQRAATSRRALAAFLIAMAFNAWFFTIGPYARMEAHGGIVDERFGSGPDAIRAAVDALGPAGRDVYGDFLAADLLFPLFNAAWLVLFLAIGTRRWRALPDGVIGLPILFVVADWTENLTFYVLLAEHPEMSYGVAAVTMVAMHAKLAFVVASALAAIAVLGWFIAHPVQRRRRS